MLNPVKGMRDTCSELHKLRTYITDACIEHFESYNGVPIDTPVCEKLGNVQTLYGEDFDKEVYRLEDQGGDPLILRYDLTVPHARYIANTGIRQGRHYQIGKVYRRDTPNAKAGRYREFMQADFDIVGTDNNLMLFEAEILSMTQNIYDDLLGSATYKIMVNHKAILYNIFKEHGIDPSVYIAVSSTIDKMNKLTREELEKELVDKTLCPTQAMGLLDNFEMYNASIQKGDDILQLFHDKGIIDDNLYNTLNQLFNLVPNIQLDPSLARGLDYYTGLVYEVMYTKQTIKTSIGAGGRYDNLIGKLGHREVPAVGVSIGVERIMTIYEREKMDIHILTENPIHIYIGSIGKGLMYERWKLYEHVRNLDLPNCIIHTNYKVNPKMGGQMNEVFENDYDIMILIGKDELDSNTVKVKFIKSKQEITIDRSDIKSTISSFIKLK